MAGERHKEALAWLEQARPRLDAAAQTIVDTPAPLTLLHDDTRSDNLRLREGRLVLFDWPWAQLGAPETEITVFAQSVAVEQGPTPDGRYRLVGGVLRHLCLASCPPRVATIATISAAAIRPIAALGGDATRSPESRLDDCAGRLMAVRLWKM
jgi:aminoglycoside phosphotransferase (APT) family kinase protein